MTRIVLFDIDGTLVLSGGAGARALARAFAEEFGIDDALSGVTLNGRTDPRIVADALERAGVSLAPDDGRLALLFSRYLAHLACEMPASAHARVLPGVLPLLARLSATPGFAVGLVTGNIETGARIKLDRFDLNGYFRFGAFGSDSAVRRELVPLAVARARALLDLAPVSPPDVIVVGDTELDVDCGRHFGARTLAVATGSVGAQTLHDAGADAVFEDLTRTDQVLETLATL